MSIRFALCSAIAVSAVAIATSGLLAQETPPAVQAAVDSVRADTSLQRRIRDLENQARLLSDTATKQAAALKLAQENLEAASKTFARSRGSISDSVSVLRARLAKLEAAQSFSTAIEDASTQIRAKTASTILDEIPKGVTFISFTQEAVELEQTEMLLTNFWSSTKVRNAWDRVDTWGGFAGGALAVLGLVNKKDEGTTEVAVGVGLVGISRFVGGVFGKGRSDKVSTVVQEIALSRTAFNQLKSRNELLRDYVASNAAFKQKVEAQRAVLGRAQSRVDTLRHVAAVKNLLDEYAPVTVQLPQYIDGVLRSVEGLIASSPSEEQKAALRPILTKAEALKKRYGTDVLPILLNADPLRALLEPDVARLQVNGGTGH